MFKRIAEYFAKKRLLKMYKIVIGLYANETNEKRKGLLLDIYDNITISLEKLENKNTGGSDDTGN